MKPRWQYLVRILYDKIYISKIWCMLGVRISSYVCAREIMRTLESCWEAESNSSFLSAGTSISPGRSRFFFSHHATPCGEERCMLMTPKD